MTTSRAAYRLTFGCNSACVFCGQGEQSTEVEFDRAALEALRAEHDALTFIGGEPTLDPALVDRVALARELGFESIGIQTNAQRFGEEPELLARLAEAGLTDLQLSLHGPIAETHDYQTGRPGSFDQILDTFRAALKLGLTIVVVTVITRSNYRDLLRMPPLLKRHGVAAWLLEYVRPHGRAATGFARVVPRFGMALPWSLHAIQQARRHSLPAWIRGAPLCGLGPFAKLSLDDPPRTHVEVCAGCAAQPRCPGVDASYLEVFDASELRPVPAPQALALDSGRRRLVGMFVGVGELVDHEPVLYSDDARAKRAEEGSKHRRLPVLASTPTPAPDSGSPES